MIWKVCRFLFLLTSAVAWLWLLTLSIPITVFLLTVIRGPVDAVVAGGITIVQVVLTVGCFSLLRQNWGIT
jgi:hypothetical protein